MITLNDKVAVNFTENIDLLNCEIIDRIEYYNKGKVGIVIKIEDDIATVESDVYIVNNKRYSSTTPIRLKSLIKIEE